MSKDTSTRDTKDRRGEDRRQQDIPVKRERRITKPRRTGTDRRTK